MAGSPTLLIDGVDPFAAPGQRDCGMSCRLYRDQTAGSSPRQQSSNCVPQSPPPAQVADGRGGAERVADPRAAAGPGREGGAPSDPASLRRHRPSHPRPATWTLSDRWQRPQPSRGADLAARGRRDPPGARRPDRGGLPVLRHPDPAPGPDRRPGRCLRDVRDRRAWAYRHARPRHPDRVRRHHHRPARSP